MNPKRRHGRAGGFSLVEMLVVVALILILSILGFPMIQNLFQRSKLEGFARETSILMRSARLTAVKTGGLENFDPLNPGTRTWSARTVVEIDPTAREVFAFVDLDAAGGVVGESDLIFNPRAGAPHKATDYEIGRFQLPNGVHFQGPDGTPDVEGFTANPKGSSFPRIAVFLPNGSIDTPGAFRLADERGNFLEVQVAPQATARIEMRKWNGTVWQAQGEGGETWNWKF